MSGPGAEFSLYGKTHNIVVLPYPADGASPDDYKIALKIAGLKTAVYLAKAGRELKPDEIEVYDLPPIMELAKGLKDLPKVAYIFQVLTTQFEPISGEPVFYGINVDSIVPTIIHPNEVLDGALTRPDRTYGVETYVIQNHPIIRELYRRHGKELYFAGVIITIAYNNAPEYERAATVAANFAKWVIGADGVILTKTGGGAPEITMAQTAQKCEELGVRTAVAMLHMAADPNDTKFEAATIFNMPEVDAIVSMGTPFMPLTLPAMERIIGRPVALPEGPPIDGEIVRLLFWIKGTTSQLGHTRLIATRY